MTKLISENLTLTILRRNTMEQFFCDYKIETSDIMGFNFSDVHPAAVINVYNEKDHSIWEIEILSSGIDRIDGTTIKGQCSFQLLSKRLSRDKSEFCNLSYANYFLRNF